MDWIGMPIPYGIMLSYICNRYTFILCSIVSMWKSSVVAPSETWRDIILPSIKIFIKLDIYLYDYTNF